MSKRSLSRRMVDVVIFVGGILAMMLGIQTYVFGYFSNIFGVWDTIFWTILFELWGVALIKMAVVDWE